MKQRKWLKAEAKVVKRFKYEYSQKMLWCWKKQKKVLCNFKVLKLTPESQRVQNFLQPEQT